MNFQRDNIIDNLIKYIEFNLQPIRHAFRFSSNLLNQN